MMRIIFGEELDGRSWPGSLGDRNAVAGETWVGPMGFLDILEIQLGLAARRLSDAERVAGLVAHLASVSGFWQESAEVDAFGTARTLLQLRDTLCLHGWNQGPSQADRVTALAALFDGLGEQEKVGVPDRLRAVHDELANRKTDMERIEHFAPIENLPALWQTVFERLKRTGVDVEQREIKFASGSSDLAQSRNKEFTVKGDGSLQLLRPRGPMAAAEHVAAWLAARDPAQLERTLIIAPDPVLDAALRRFGLPATGGSATPHDNGLLETLPLMLALGWKPTDPQHAMDLLTLAESPVPWQLRAQLQRALTKWPAVGSHEWEARLQSSLKKIGDKNGETGDADIRTTDSIKAERVVRMVFEGEVNHGDSYPAIEVKHRVQVAREWAEHHIRSANGTRGQWQAVLSQCDMVDRLVTLCGREKLPYAELAKLIKQATPAGRSPFGAEAGLAWVGTPGAVLGEADCVLWWNFTRDSMPSSPRIPLTSMELDTLQAEGVHLPTPSDYAERAERAYQLPWKLARKTLVLVCPRVKEDGEAHHPHALWDSIRVHACRGSAENLMVQRLQEPDVRLAPRKLLPVPEPHCDWVIPKGVAVSIKDGLSVSVLGQFLGCSFSWAIQHKAKLRFKRKTSLPTGALLAGSLAHYIILENLLGPDKPLPETPDLAERLAGELFDTLAPKLAGDYFLPGNLAEREQTRNAITRCARELVDHLHRAGLSSPSPEEEIKAEMLGTSLSGRIDLALGDPAEVLIDLKWGRADDRKRELKRGAAYQLATYAAMKTKKDKLDTFPSVAYCIILNQQVLTTDDRFDGQTTSGPSPEDTWAGIEAACKIQVQLLLEKKLRAPAKLSSDKERGKSGSLLEGGVLQLDAPCQYCSFGALCGSQFGETE